MIAMETEKVQVSRALDAGGNEYIMKPFTRDIPLEKPHFLGIMQVST